MSKLSKFNQDHEEPWFYDDYTLVISAELYTKEEAAKLLIAEYNDYFARQINEGKLVEATEEMVKEDRVRFCIMSGSDIGNDPAWFLGSKGKGSKPVYCIF